MVQRPAVKEINAMRVMCVVLIVSAIKYNVDGLMIRAVKEINALRSSMVVQCMIPMCAVLMVSAIAVD